MYILYLDTNKQIKYVSVDIKSLFEHKLNTVILIIH